MLLITIFYFWALKYSINIIYSFWALHSWMFVWTEPSVSSCTFKFLHFETSTCINYKLCSKIILAIWEIYSNYPNTKFHWKKCTYIILEKYMAYALMWYSSFISTTFWHPVCSMKIMLVQFMIKHYCKAVKHNVECQLDFSTAVETMIYKFSYIFMTTFYATIS